MLDEGLNLSSSDLRGPTLSEVSGFTMCVLVGGQGIGPIHGHLFISLIGLVSVARIVSSN
jgi:hypothetical protein